VVEHVTLFSENPTSLIKIKEPVLTPPVQVPLTVKEAVENELPFVGLVIVAVGAILS
jgi:hypothetical protein